MSELTDDLRGYSIGQILTRLDVEAIVSAADVIEAANARADTAGARAKVAMVAAILDAEDMCHHAAESGYSHGAEMCAERIMVLIVGYNS